MHPILTRTFDPNDDKFDVNDEGKLLTPEPGHASDPDATLVV